MAGVMGGGDGVDSWAWHWSGVWGEQLADLVAPLCLSRSAKCERLVENREDETETICSEDRGPKQLPAWNVHQEKDFLEIFFVSSTDLLSNVHPGPVWVD